MEKSTWFEVSWGAFNFADAEVKFRTSDIAELGCCTSRVWQATGSWSGRDLASGRISFQAKRVTYSKCGMVKSDLMNPIESRPLGTKTLARACLCPYIFFSHWNNFQHCLHHFFSVKCQGNFCSIVNRAQVDFSTCTFLLCSQELLLY